MSPNWTRDDGTSDFKVSDTKLNEDDVIKLDWRQISHLIGLIETAFRTNGQMSALQNYLLKDLGVANYKVEGIIETVIKLYDNAQALQACDGLSFTELDRTNDNRKMLNLLLGDAFGEGTWF